jgi:rod shape determining protein RodA
MFERALNNKELPVLWPMWLALVGLMLMGGFFIFSATQAQEHASQLPWHRQLFFKQTLIYGLGLSIAATVCLVQYHKMARWSLVLYWLTILLLILVLVPAIGTKIYGARRWINLGFFQFQPSEFAKIAFLLAQAHFLSRPVEELRSVGLFAKSLGLTALPFVLIVLEPDLGSALVLIPIGLAMMFVAGMPVKYLGRLVGGAALVIGLLVGYVLFAPPALPPLLEDYQRSRLMVYFGRDFAPANATPAERQRAREIQRQQEYNVRQALISVGSGGLTGKGWRQGTQNALGYLPRAVAHNDFIFSVIAEEKGFMGSVIVLTLYAVVLFTGIKVAGQARDRLGKLLAVGVVAMLFSHVFINIGMNIRLMPVTGIPLPLLSYGGTSVLCSLIAAGILQNVYLYRRS